MKNPFTPEERVLFLKRLELEHYSKPGILSKTPEATKTLLSQDEFKISEYEDLVWCLCYISSQPTYDKELFEIYTKHDAKLIRLQQQAGIFVKRPSDSDKTRVVSENEARTQKGNIDHYLDSPFLERVYRKYVLNHDISIWSSIRKQQERKKLKEDKCRHGRMVSQSQSQDCDSSQEGSGSIPLVGGND